MDRLSALPPSRPVRSHSVPRWLGHGSPGARRAAKKGDERVPKKERLGGGRGQRTLTAVTLVAGLIGGATLIPAPLAPAAWAAPPAAPLCEGFSACSTAPYTTHDFQNEYKTSYWRMPPDQDTAPGGAWANCTNYAAFVESTVYGVPTPKHLLPINAMNWATGAREDGFMVNHTPTVGSVAQWYANDNNGVIGPTGTSPSSRRSGRKTATSSFPKITGPPTRTITAGRRS